MKTVNEHHDSWVAGMVSKRSLLVLKILADLVEAGLRTGQCSANDIHTETDKTNCNAVGATFKLLPKFGFCKTTETVDSNRKKCRHGGTIFVWQLAEPGKALAFLSQVRVRLLEVDGDGSQLRLAV